MYSFFNNYTGDGAPSFSKFARESGLTMERLESFRKNAEFDRIWRECKEIRKDIIIDRALCKRADASFAKFLLSEEGGGGGEDAIDLTITVIDQRMKIDLTVTKKQKSFIENCFNEKIEWHNNNAYNEGKSALEIYLKDKIH